MRGYNNALIHYETKRQHDKSTNRNIDLISQELFQGF